METDSLAIIIGGDIVPTASNFELFENGDVCELIGDDLIGVLDASDYTVFNLETPLADSITPIMKHGPNLIAPTSTANGLSAICSDAFALANNHILDQGSFGLESTIRTLETYGIKHFGAGMNLNEASEPLLIRKGNLSVAVYACAEHEFSIATETSAGANPFDSLYSFDVIERLANKNDYVVVLYHGGKEHYRYPSPMLRKNCRKMVESGASLIVCQHSHCIGAIEEYEESTILYGQGNFLFDDSDSECWRTGLLLKADFTKSGISLTYYPLQKCENRVRLAKDDNAKVVLDDLAERSKRIEQDSFVEDEFRRLANECLYSYLKRMIPGTETKLFRALYKLSRGRILNFIMSRNRVHAMLNFIECESHRELLIEGLKHFERF